MKKKIVVGIDGSESARRGSGRGSCVASRASLNYYSSKAQLRPR